MTRLGTKVQPMKRCSCYACRRGLRSKTYSHLTRLATRRFRRAARAALRLMEEPNSVFTLGYTD